VVPGCLETLDCGAAKGCILLLLQPEVTESRRYDGLGCLPASARLSFGEGNTLGDRNNVTGTIKLPKSSLNHKNNLYGTLKIFDFESADVMVERDARHTRSYHIAARMGA
jgi:hypothetical protein